MTFTQHVPGCVSGVDPLTFTCDTVEELLAHPWVAGWRLVIEDGTAFSHYARSGNSSSHRDYLMAVFGDNVSWWVLGYADEPLNLPTWQPPTSFGR